MRPIAADLPTLLERAKVALVNPEAAKAHEREVWLRGLAEKRLPANILRLLVSGRDEAGRPLRRNTYPYTEICAATASGKRLVLVTGQPGTGKTCAACVWLADQPAGRFACVDEVCQLAPWESQSRYADCEPLVLDDLGVEQPSEFGKLERLINARYASLRTTICTTNLSGRQLSERYEGRVLSRLREIGALVVCSSLVRPGDVP